ncbi:hypothetical protein JR316_0004654 [Psilocybe cubensis]|uniref:DH domain-containing protein n=2 Tax=Psilocybe cubensis TaxID=181762 RepID=A0A8H8CKW2_PSICU|nr:hypothetical protein JR316_0004654 [Psilocybe cubensis]KAH9482554.1 hypothetical protein JR316_0004654 [Psilocybe cubensis]
MPFVCSFRVDPPHSTPEHSGPTNYSNNSSTSLLLLQQSSEPLEGASTAMSRARNDLAGAKPESMLLKSTTEPRSPRRLNICGFSPLPPIIASPICTPTPSQSSQSRSGSFFTTTDAKDNTSADTSASSCSSLRVLLSPSTPTWIATPPTPPSKSVRRSNTSSRRRSVFKALSPSASFPASMHPHGNQNVKTLKRSSSLPTFAYHLGPLSFSPTNFMCEDIVECSDALSTWPGETPLDATFSVIDGFLGPDNTLRSKDHSYSNIFHLSNATSQGEEESTVCEKSGACTPDEPSPDGSWSDHSVEDIWEIERHKDALRKYHALKELLATEVGYLVDLKALVTVYLRNLPTLAVRPLSTSSTFSRASSSFATGPWIHSYAQLQATALSSSATLPDTQNIPSSASASIQTPAKVNLRYLFSDSELESLTRNAEEILSLHEHFVRELRAILDPLGIAVDHVDEDHGHHHLARLDDAIRAVSTKFATEASRFNAYQIFCAGHPEAMDIVRKGFQQFPLELEAFEHRCATMVSDMLEAGTKPPASEPKHTSSVGSDSPTNQSQSLNVDDRKRAMSSSSLDGGVRSSRPRSGLLMTKDSVVFPSESKREKTTPRIAFMDYMIKPIQRICKYPLLLDQLLPSKALRTLGRNTDTRSDVDVVVESAAQAMRHVATSVDEARHRQEIAVQSALILSRICIGSASASPSPSAQPLTLEFFASLGNCLLSGSLDLMYHDPSRPLDQSSSIKAKYFGAFLYTGGYLILVKVSKGKKYEPKHWFSLVDFEVSDVEDDGSLLPCSFRLSFGDRHFELAAACQREKDAWLSSIHESLTHVPTWINEPTPSFKFDDKGELLPGSDDGNIEVPQTGLATIRSIPELGGHASDAEFSEPFFASLRGHGKSRKRRPGYETPPPSKQDIPPPPSRRSSSTSVKAIFSPMGSDNETVLIRRSSPAARLQVDQELQDVISQSILTARSHAFSHEVELFQAPKTTRSGFSRSNSAIGMAGMGRLSKHESVRVPRRRTTESLDGLLNRGSSPLNKSASSSSARRNLKKLSLTSIDYELPSLPVESPCPSSPSSQASSRVTSLLVADNNPPVLDVPTTFISSEKLPAKSRSFVRNVRGIFHLRPNSPMSVIVSHPSQSSVPLSGPMPGQPMTHYSMLHRWTVRRRARSVHDEPRPSLTMFDDNKKSYTVTPSRTSTPLST